MVEKMSPSNNTLLKLNAIIDNQGKSHCKYLNIYNVHVCIAKQNHAMPLQTYKICKVFFFLQMIAKF